MLLIDTPRHKTFASLAWTPLRRLSLLADLHHEAGRWNQNEASRFLRAPSYALLFLAGSFQIARGADLRAGLNNLLNRNYWLVAGYPETGRNWFLQMRYRF